MDANEIIYKRHKVKKKSTIGLISVFVSINFWVLFFFLRYALFIYIPIFFSVFTLIVFIGRILKQKNDFDKISKKSVIDSLKLIKKYIKINKKFIAVMTLGVIISTTIISQSFILSSTYEEKVFENYFGSFGLPPAIEFEIYDNLENFDQFKNILPNISQDIQFEFKSKNIDFDRAEVHPFIYYSESNFTSRYISNKIMSFDQETYDILKEFPSFDQNKIPYKENATYMFYSYIDYDGNVEIIQNNILNKQVPILIGNEGQETVNFTIPIDYFWILTYEDTRFLYNTNLRHNSYLKNIVSGALLVNNTYQNELMRDILSIYEDTSNIYGDIMKFSTIVQFYTKIDNIRDIDLNTLSQNLVKLERSTDSIMRNSKYDINYIGVPLYMAINQYQDDTLAMNSIMIMLMIPMISLSVFLVYFSLALIEHRKKKLLSLMRYRGTSEKQMRTLLNSEVLITSIIALISGMILSLPYTLLTLSNMSQFDVSFDLSSLNIPEAWYWKLPIIAIVITFDMNISSILSLSKVKIDEMEITEQNKSPFWQRAYIDMILFIFSTIFWIVYHLVPFEPQVKQLITYSVGPIFIFLQIFSTPLVIARYFSQFIVGVSDLLWKINGGIIALATRNLKKNKFTSARLTSLLTIGIMLSTMALILPHTMIENSKNEATYRVGADIVVTGIDYKNITQMKGLEINGIETYTEIIKLDLNNPSKNELDQNILEFNFLGVNKTTISDVLIWQEDYAESSLETILSKLENRSIAMQSIEIIAMGIENTKELSMAMNSTFNEVFDVVSEFTYFPHHVNTIPRQSYYSGDNYYFDTISLVGTYELIEEIADLYGSPTLIKKEILIKVSEDANITNIAESIRNLDETYTVITQDDYIDKDLSIFEFVLIFSFIENMLLITILVGAIAVFYFSFMTLTDRRKEIGVFRSVGMIRKQVFMLLIIEISILMIISLISGIFIGYFISLNFLSLGMADPYSVPKFKMFIPYDKITIFILLMISLTFVASGIPAYHISKKQTGSILRSE